MYHPVANVTATFVSDTGERGGYIVHTPRTDYVTEGHTLDFFMENHGRFKERTLCPGYDNPLNWNDGMIVRCTNAEIGCDLDELYQIHGAQAEFDPETGRQVYSRTFIPSSENSRVLHSRWFNLAYLSYYYTPHVPEASASDKDWRAQNCRYSFVSFDAAAQTKQFGTVRFTFRPTAVEDRILMKSLDKRDETGVTYQCRHKLKAPPAKTFASVQRQRDDVLQEYRISAENATSLTRSRCAKLNEELYRCGLTFPVSFDVSVQKHAPICGGSSGNGRRRRLAAQKPASRTMDERVAVAHAAHAAHAAQTGGEQRRRLAAPNALC